MIVMIDDERSFKDTNVQAVILRNSKDALDWFDKLPDNAVIDQLWFDHDLGIVDGEKDSTIPVLRMLEELCFFGKEPEIRQIVVHTSNRVGGDEIEKSMKRYFKMTRVYAGDYLTVI